jgi:hypothetical protein
MLRIIATGLALSALLPQIATATPIVVVKTKDGYVVGTNAVQVTEFHQSGKEVAANICKPIVVGNLALVFAGDIYAAKQMVRNGPYVKTVDFYNDYKKILENGGSIDDIRDRIEAKWKEDVTRSLMEKSENIRSRLINETGANLLLLRVNNNKVELSAVTMRTKQDSANPGGIGFEEPTDHSADATSGKLMIWLDKRVQLPDAPGDESWDSRLNLVENCLQQITEAAKKGDGPTGFDPPYLFLEVGPKQIKLIDKENVCTTKTSNQP